MNKLRLFHIPAVATSAVAVLVQPVSPIVFMLGVLMGSMLVVAVAALASRMTKKLTYPLFW